jgi:hypothetical protein
MRSDVGLERKCVHLKLRRGVHTAMRELLLRRDMSLQEVLNAFVEEVVQGNRSAIGVVDRLAAEKLRRKLGPLKPKKCMRGSDIQHPVFEHDADSLYALIQEGGLDDDIVDPDEGTDD